MAIYNTIKSCKICQSKDRGAIEKAFVDLDKKGTKKKKILDTLNVRFSGYDVFEFEKHFYDPHGNKPHFAVMPSVDALQLLKNHRKEMQDALKELENVSTIRKGIELLSEAIVARELKRILENPNEKVEVKDLVALMKARNESEDKRRMVQVKENELKKDAIVESELLNLIYGQHAPDRRTKQVKSRGKNDFISEA